MTTVLVKNKSTNKIEYVFSEVYRASCIYNPRTFTTNVIVIDKFGKISDINLDGEYVIEVVGKE